jgi:predicted nucleic acid-binding Zn ribbon protein
MFDIRKIIVVLLIAILFSVFVFSTINAVYPSPSYSDFCDNNPRAPMKVETECTPVDVPQEAYDSCEGYIDYERDSNGCATSYYCETCSEEYEAAQDRFHQIMFYISAVLALIVIFVSLNLPVKKNNDVHEWIGTGLLLGGAFVLLFGTVQGFTSLDRFVKPVVMLAELALVIYLAYKKFS